MHFLEKMVQEIYPDEYAGWFVGTNKRNIVVNGNTVNLDSPSKAASLGIGMVHQHFMLVEAFTVAENIILGSETTKHGVLDLKKASQDIA